MPNSLPRYHLLENYTYPVTIPLSQWRKYVSQGNNVLYGDAVYPETTSMDGAVISGHVRQNPMTAMLPESSTYSSNYEPL